MRGEPGSGRSRVAADVADLIARNHGAASLRLRTYPGIGSSSRTLADGVRSLESGLTAATRESLSRVVKEGLRQSQTAAALFADLEWDGDVLRQAVSEHTQGRPLLLVLDEARHTEEATWSFLRALLGAVIPQTTRVLLVADSDQPVPPFGDVDWLTQRVAPWTAEPLQEVLQAEGVSELIADASARALVTAGLARPRYAKALSQILKGESPDLSVLDDGAPGLYRARLEAIPPDLREVLDAAAVSRSGINYWRMERLGVYERTDLEELTSHLEAREILKPSYPRGKLKLVFADDLERSVVYDSLGEMKRRLLHDRFARVVSEDDLDPAEKHWEVGRHLMAAGNALDGAEHLLEAGRRLSEQGQVERARRLFEEVESRGRSERALELERLYALEEMASLSERTGHMGEMAERFQEVVNSPLLGPKDRGRVLRKLAVVLVDSGQLDAAEARIAEALKLTCPPEERVRLALLTARIASRRGQTPEARDELHRARRRAEELRDPALRAAVHRALGSLAYEQGEMHEALAEFSLAHELFTQVGDPAGHAATGNYLGNTLSALGRREDSLTYYRQALRTQEGLHNESAAATVRHNMATLLMDTGELEEAEQSFLECARVWKERGDMDGVATAYVNIASVARLRGDELAALEKVELALQVGEELQGFPGRLTAEIVKAEALGRLGRLTEARSLATALRDDAREHGRAQKLAWAQSCLGRVLRDAGDLDRAVECQLDALRLSQQHGYPDQIRDSLSQLAHLELARDDLGAAGRYLQMMEEATPEDDQQEVVLLRSRLDIHAHRELARGDRQDLERWARPPGEGGDASILARAEAHELLARSLPPPSALPHARAAYAAQKQMNQPEEVWRAALRLGELETELELPEAADHLDEAAQVILNVASQFSDEDRATYLGAQGRRLVLRHARGLD